MASQSPSTPMSKASTLPLSPTPRLRRGFAFVGSPPQTPPMKGKKSKASSPKSHTSGTPSSSSKKGPNKTVRKTVLKVNSPKSPKTSSPKSPKTSSPKSPKTSPKNQEKTPKKNQSPKTKMSPGMKKPSASMSPMKGSPRLSLKDKVKKDNFQNILAKIYNEYDDMKQYNKSFNCPPNCTWAVSLGSKGDDVMCVVWDDYGTD